MENKQKIILFVILNKKSSHFWKKIIILFLQLFTYSGMICDKIIDNRVFDHY